MPYYLTCSQIEEYADEILEKLGQSHSVRDDVYGGVDYYWYEYGGYGIYIYNYDRRNTTIKYDGSLVYDYAAEDYCPGEWELVLKELYDSIPKILARQKEVMELKERNQALINDCLKYLVDWSHHETLSGKVTGGNYEDPVIRIKVDDIGIRFYKKNRSKWIPLKMVYKLVYDSADIGQQDDIFRDQNVCEHLERKIAEAKIRTEEAARIKAERERESLPKPSDYINQLRNL